MLYNFILACPEGWFVRTPLPTGLHTVIICKTLHLHNSKSTFYLQYGPRITPNNTAFVHHIIVYLCDGLVNVTEGTSSECFGQATAGPISECRQGAGLGGWAVGGEVRTQE